MVQAVRRKHHYIYKITRADGSGKYYIGMHSTDNLDDGYFGSGSLLSKSIKKHGKDQHIKEILEHLPTREALKLREKELVNEELLDDKRCMNLKLGGEGGWEHLNGSSEVQRAKGLKGNARMKELRETDQLWVEKIAKAASEGNKKAYANGNRKPTMPNWIGRKHSDATKTKISAARKARTSSSNIDGDALSCKEVQRSSNLRKSTKIQFRSDQSGNGPGC